MRITKLLIVDDHAMVRDGFKALLKTQPDMEVVGEAANGRDALKLATECTANVVLMDITMRDMNGIEATRRLCAALPNVKVIALSMHSERHMITEILCAGASGYVLKECAFAELATAIRTVMKNQTYLSPQVASLVVDEYKNRAAPHPSSDARPLSPREREVLQLLAEGHSTKDIADRVKISVKTVETHVLQIKKKLNVYSIAELTKYAIRNGLSSLDI